MSPLLPKIPVLSLRSEALSALLFLYREVLHKVIPDTINAARAKRPKRLPTVLTKEEATKVIACIPEEHRLMPQLLYGCGLRLMECVRLRVKDVDFAQHHIVVRESKGMQDRLTMLPETLIDPLQRHLRFVKYLHTVGLWFLDKKFVLCSCYFDTTFRQLFKMILPITDLYKIRLFQELCLYSTFT